MYVRALLQLEPSQELLARLIAQRVSTLDIPLEITPLKLSLGRLQGGEVRQCRFGPALWQLEIAFATGPTVEARVRLLEFRPDTQTLDLELEEFHLSGFAGARLANLGRRKLLEVAAARANAQVPGLVTLQNGMRLWLHLGPILQKALFDPRLREAIETRLGLEPNVSLRARAVRLEEGKAVVELEGQL